MLFNDQYQKPNVDEINQIFMSDLKKYTLDYFSKKFILQPNDIKLYFYDDYILKTAVHSNTPSIIYLEIDAPLNFKSNKNNKQFTFNHEKLIAPKLHLPLKNIKEDLYNILVNSLDSNFSIWKDKYSIMISTGISNKNDLKNYYTFKIIPCLTYLNSNDKRGVIYYNDYLSEIIVEYPKLSIINYRIKDKQTKGLLNELTKSMKYQYLLATNEIELPDYIFETLAYNVPLELFKQNDVTTYFNIINYLKTLNLANCKSINEQSKAFKNKYTSLSALYAKQAIKTINKFILTN